MSTEAFITLVSVVCCTVNHEIVHTGCIHKTVFGFASSFHLACSLKTKMMQLERQTARGARTDSLGESEYWGESRVRLPSWGFQALQHFSRSQKQLLETCFLAQQLRCCHWKMLAAFPALEGTYLLVRMLLRRVASFVAVHALVGTTRHRDNIPSGTPDTPGHSGSL